MALSARLNICVVSSPKIQNYEFNIRSLNSLTEPKNK